MIKFTKTTKKFGTVEVLVDAQDAYLLETLPWTLVSTKTSKKPYVVFARTISCGELSQKKFHRVILNASEGAVVDHINRNTLDNRRENLRLVSRATNALNASKRVNALGKYKGVHYASKLKKFIAQIQFEKVKTHIGVFDDEISAAKAYDTKAKELFKDYAVLNFPQENT
jgi:hypothetical protein